MDLFPSPSEYSDAGEGPASGRHNDNAASVDDEESAQRSRPRASYALMLEKARDKAIRTVKGDYTPTDHDWAASLSLAPFAIFSMVSLFQAANQECAAGIKVDTLDIMDLNGLVRRGKLPSQYFRTNVQHCGDVGREAYIQAQHEMGAIHSMARALTDEKGSIANLVNFLEDPDDIRRNLKPEMDVIWASVSKCLGAAKAIVAKFHYWQLVITHLKKDALTTKEKVTDEKRHRTQNQRDAEVESESALRSSARKPTQHDSRLLSKSDLDLERIRADIVALENMMTILESSAHHLGVLKYHIELLENVFKEMLELSIENTMETDVKAFLRLIHNSLDPDHAESFRLSKQSKETVIAAALRLQGRFSVTVHISGAYIEISNTHLQPAIGRMEWLKKDDFEAGCKRSVEQIGKLAAQVRRDFEGLAEDSIRAFVKRLIEATEECG
ncbi:hypothetical protein B0T24DRAFT_716473 [Lasiosphaeria ovina]|uniref:Uncharacterized protein n=1 Tax=Lasiosphaeria ovina TaxID=92902 RepID=A0AAE0NCL3_9PEZI|nr:hypothetical protein B0T24DRAFT_716473 [Lasiosphaeria ovina]